MLPGSPNISAMKSRKALVIAILLIMAAAYAQQPEAKRPERIRVSSGVAEGLLVHKVDPVYPREAIEKKIQGDVVLQVVIDTQGSIATLTTISGHPLLADAATEAVRQWHYRPYLLNGVPVQVETTVTVKFHM